MCHIADPQDVLLTLSSASQSPVDAYGIGDSPSNLLSFAPQLSTVNFDYRGYTSGFMEEGSSPTDWGTSMVKVEDVEEAAAFDEPLEIQDTAPYDNCGLETYDSLEFQSLRESNTLFSETHCSL